MRKTNKKLASAIVLGLMLAVPVGVSAADFNASDINVSKDFTVGSNQDAITNVNGYLNINNGSSVVGGSILGEKITLDGGSFQNDGVLVIGDKDHTESVEINGGSKDGLFIRRNDASLKGEMKVEIKATDSIKINCDATSGYAGIWLQNNTEQYPRPENVATLNLEADNIEITSKGLALVVFSNSELNINGNLNIDSGEVAIDTRGNALININQGVDNENNTTVINGDIVFETPNSPGDAQNSGKIINSEVNINFNGNNSEFNGKVYQMYKGDNGEAIDSVEFNTPPYYGNVTGMKMQFNNGAAWNMTGDSFVNNVTLNNGGTINVQEDVTKFNAEDVSMNNGIIDMQGSGQSVNINNLSGTGVVNTESLGNKMTIDTVDIGASLTVNGSGDIADEIYQGKATAQDLAEVVKTGNTTAADRVTTDEGIIAGRYEFDVDKDGKVDTANGSYTKNTKNEAISNMASISLMAWRAENNDMNKRLGELRNSKGEHGVWARMVRGESEYGAQSIKNVYNTYQLGYDEKLSTNDHWTVGAAISYTDGQSSFDNGSGENTSKGLSFYGSYLGDNGEFVDLIAKYARLDNEFDVAGGVGSGDYSTNGYSFSAEYGKRTQLANDFYIEPQVELTYGRVADVDFVTKNGAKVSQDSMDSLVGRVGLAAGKNIKNGNVYVRASYLYDFDGETNVTFSNAGASESFSEDLGGGWFEFGIGTNINLSDGTYLYFDVEKTTGGEVDTNWQWNAGVRYSF